MNDNGGINRLRPLYPYSQVEDIHREGFRSAYSQNPSLYDTIRSRLCLIGGGEL